MRQKFTELCITVSLVIATTGFVVHGCTENTVHGWLTSGIFVNTRMASSTRCQRLCWYTMSCSSCSWGSQSYACRLSKETRLTSPGSFSVISDHIHSDVLSLPCKKKSHACASRPCGAQEVCIPTEATKSYICLKDKLLLLPLSEPLKPEATSSPAVTFTSTTAESVTTATSTTTIAPTEETTFTTIADHWTSSADTATTTLTELAPTTTASVPTTATTTVQDIAPETTATTDAVTTTATTDAVTTTVITDAVTTTATTDAVTTTVITDAVTTTATTDAVTTTVITDAVTTTATTDAVTTTVITDAVTTTSTTAAVTTATTTDVVTTTAAITTTSVAVTSPTLVTTTTAAPTKTTSLSAKTTAAVTTAAAESKSETTAAAAGGIPNCLQSCAGITGGYFHTCDSCYTYVRCSNEILSIMPCNDGLVWHDDIKICNWPPSPTC